MTLRDSQIGGHGKTETEAGVIQSQPRRAWSHQKLEEARKDSPIRAFGGGGECPTNTSSDFWYPEL